MVTIRNRPRPESQFVDVFDEDQVQKAIIYRKAKYDEGAEKVQSQINQLGQLPTITPEDAKIVQDKVTNLTSNINSIAGLDLSNQFNINKVSSMSSDITNDPTIQAAVSSARNLQKNQKFMEDAKLNPKKFGNVIAVQNEDDFYGQLQKHKEQRASGKDSIFSYSYKPYTDVQGEISKRMEKIKADVVMGKAGDYFTKDETITADKIRNIAYGMIQAEPKFQDQMRINSTFATKGVSDEQLLMQKNRFQIADIREREQAIQKKVTNLYDIDQYNPKETAKIVKQYKDEVAKYETRVKFLQDNPNKLIDTETGVVDDKKYDRSQLAYELSSYALGSNLVNSFSKNNRILSVNAAVLKREELNWSKQMDRDEFRLKVEESRRQDEELILKKQTAAWEVKKTAKVSEFGGISYSSPEAISAMVGDPEVVVNSMIGQQKLEVQGMLKDVMLEKLRTIQGISGGGMNQQYLDKLVDSMITPDGKIKDFNDDGTIKRMQAYSMTNTGIAPNVKILQEGLKFVHKIKKDVDNIWNNDKMISPEHIDMLKKYTDGVHQIATLQASSEFASNKAAMDVGFKDKKSYDAYFKTNSKRIIHPLSYSSKNPQEMIEDNTPPDAKAKIEQFNKSKAEYITKRIASTKLYPVVNFNEKDSDTYFNIKSDFSDLIKSGIGADVTGKMSIDGIYGKVDKWSDFKLDTSADIFPTRYNAKSGIVTARVKTGKGAEAVEGEYKFYVGKVDKYITKEMSQGMQPMTYDDALGIADNGKLQIKVNRRNVKTGKIEPKLEDAWKYASTNIAPLKWKAERINPKDVGDRQVNVYIEVPFDGVPQTIKVKTSNPFPSAADAETTMQNFVNNEVVRLERQGYPKEVVKKEILKYLQKINDRI